MRAFILPCLVVLLAQACAPSPLWRGGEVRPLGSREVPRDARGEPILDRIPPPPGSVLPSAS